MVIRALDRKLLRDLWKLKGQALAIAAVMAAGVAMLVAYLSTFDSLERAQLTYYDRNRFADVFAQLKRAPLALRDRIAAIPGVSAAETRVVADVTLDIEGMREPALGRLVSIPVPDRPVLNQLFVRMGRLPDPARPDEVLVNEAFARAHDFRPGATIRAVINGRRRTLRVVGIALSPEYIYTVRPGELIPDDARFGILWMERRALAAAFNMEGGFNDVTLKLEPGANEAAVIAALDLILEPYGGLGAIPRSLQLSNWSISNELAQLRGFGLIVPTIFLAVAAFLLNVVLTRTVSVQREQIAALKALGYANRDLGWHYTKWSMVIAFAGALLGTLGGAWMGNAMTGLYNAYFRFPTLDYALQGPVVVGAWAVSFVAAVFGALGAVRRAVSLPPAEAMRPEPPARYRASLVERIGLAQLLGPPGRMIVRNVERQPVRTATSVTGIAFAAAMLVVGLFFLDAIDEILRVQFDIVERQDVTVNFVEPRSPGALYEMQRLPGVLAMEPSRTLPVRLRKGHRSRQLAITGLVATPKLQRVVNVSAEPVPLPPGGLVLSRVLAERLAIAPGDLVTVEVLEGRRPIHQVRVSALVDEYLGMSAYMEIGALHDLMREGDILSGGYLKVDAAEEDRLYRQLKLTPAVAGVALKRAALESFRKTMDETMGVMIFFNVLFASTIAFGVVYNAARISFSERSRELASLRVLGFTRAEISFILLGELALVTAIGIPVGLLLGYGLAWLIVAAFETELYRFPVVVSTRTYAIAVLVTLAAAAVSGLVVRRRLDHLDLVEVLKTRE